MSTTLSELDTLSGWDRGSKPPGLRNHVIAFSTVALCDQITRDAASSVPETLAITPQFERGLRGKDAAIQKQAIGSVVEHPNVGAALVITHDRASAEALTLRFSDSGKPVIVMSLMAASGMEAARADMISSLKELHNKAGEVEKRHVKASELIVALECGGSDASSSVCANPAIGSFVDLLVAAGGTAIVSETAEFLGGEAVVCQQSKTPEIAKMILACMAHEEALMLEIGEDYRGVNPTQENIEGGLSTLTEKTMGALCKIGSSSFTSCLDFGQTPSEPGLHFMDTPFFSPTSLSGMALGGAQIALFAVGVFNPSGLPIMPVIKICGNPSTVANWRECIDLDVTDLIQGVCSLDATTQMLTTKFCEVGNGHPAATETFKEGQLILPRTIAAL